MTSPALAAIRAAPGHYTAESLADAHGWDRRLTAQDVAELRRHGRLYPAGAFALVPGRGLPDVDPRDGWGRAVVMAITDGHRSVVDIARALGSSTSTTERRVRRAVERMVRAGVVYPLRRLVPT